MDSISSDELKEAITQGVSDAVDRIVTTLDARDRRGGPASTPSYGPSDPGESQEARAARDAFTVLGGLQAFPGSAFADTRHQSVGGFVDRQGRDLVIRLGEDCPETAAGYTARVPGREPVTGKIAGGKIQLSSDVLEALADQGAEVVLVDVNGDDVADVMIVRP